MSKFVCDCDGIISDYCGGCTEKYCRLCIQNYIAKYGKNGRECSARCDKCVNNTYEESEDESEEESEEESKDETEKKPEGEPLTAESFLAIIGKFNDEAEKREQQEKSEIIWRVSIDFQNEQYDTYFKNKNDAKKYLHDEIKDLIEDSNSYDEKGDLDVSSWKIALQSYKLN